MAGAGAYAMIPAADCALARAVRSRPLIGLGAVTDVTGSGGNFTKLLSVTSRAPIPS